MKDTTKEAIKSAIFFLIILFSLPVVGCIFFKWCDLVERILR